MGYGLCQQRLTFSDVAIDQIVVVDATEIEAPVCFINFFAGDTDVVQSLSSGGVTKYLLEKQQLAGVVAAHHHLMIGEGLTQCMGRHTITKAKVFSDTLKHKVNGLLADRLVFVHSIIGLAAEHIVAEVNTGRVFKIQSHSFHNCCVNGDVAVALMLACVPGLLFQNGEPVTKGAIIIDDVGEAQGAKVADTKSKVNANDEQHIVSETLLSNEELGDADDVIHTLDGLSSVLDSKVSMHLLGGGSDETSLELTAALLDGCDVDDTGGTIRLVEV